MKLIDYLKKMPEGNLESQEELVKAINSIVENANAAVRFMEMQDAGRVVDSRKHIRRLEKMQEMVTMYLDRTLDERSKMFALHFKVIDSAIEHGNKKLLSIGLNKIQQLAKTVSLQAVSSCP